ncbi:VOC family protein [Nonomuraea sp. B12E4]|uniref:VOC family protein n=1 Tax=Nonomuraea sp. B12E4 TaxID=3153564 RepID=UPI00325C778B
MTAADQVASVRYIVDDVQAAVDFYTTHLGFTANFSAAPAFADVTRGPLRLLLSGPTSSGARAGYTPTGRRICSGISSLRTRLSSSRVSSTASPTPNAMNVGAHSPTKIPHLSARAIPSLSYCLDNIQDANEARMDTAPAAYM